MGISRRHLLTSFSLLVLASAAKSHGLTRKSLSFKQALPNTKFVTDPPSTPSVVVSGDAHLYHTAMSFVTEHIPGISEFHVRNDSYTDQNTGISHVYVRQLVNGIEVADGEVNLNIRDGQVLSYGSSVFTGSRFDILDTPRWGQEAYCAEIPQGSDSFACEDSLNRLRVAASLYPTITKHRDPIAAAYFFTLAAYPDVLPSNFHVDSVVATQQNCSESIYKDCWTVSPLPGVLSPVKAQLVYVQTHTPGHDHTHLNLAWRLEVEMKHNYYEAYVSAYDPSKIIASMDWVKDAPAPRSDGWLTGLQAKVFGASVFGSEQYPVLEVLGRIVSGSSSATPGGTYRVWKWGINDPESGDRTLEVSPYIKSSSPLGWHSVPAGRDPIKLHPELDDDVIVNSTKTVGNNAIAQANWDGGSDWKDNHRPDGGPDLVFDFPYGPKPGEDPLTHGPRQDVNASITQLFYMTNTYHDLLYLYGFDEPSGNFQQYNFGKGGAEGDAIIVDGQDGSGFNNANFLTPRDGTNGRCRMFLFNAPTPFRDGGLDAGILIHELSHGLSTRLTGGPQSPSCLNTRESGGMGEGWGDWIATMVRSTSTYSDYPIAAWAMQNDVGIRNFPYSLNTTVNPELYDFLQKDDYREVHAIGEVWAEILWVVANKLIDKHGFADSLFPTDDADFYKVVARENGDEQLVPKKGNTLALQLIVNGLKTQPCNPTLIQARDAIIAADKALTGGENKCLLWSGFASRGLGTDAKKIGFAPRPSINGFKLPPECQKTAH